MKWIRAIGLAAALTAGLAPAAPAQEAARFDRKEYVEALAGHRDMHRFNRLSGLLADLLREQKRIHDANYRNEPNTAAEAAENYLNDAGLAGSQQDYDAAWASFGKCYGILLASLNGGR